MANSYIVCSRSIDPLSKIIWQFIGIKSFKLDIVYTDTHTYAQTQAHTNTHTSKYTHKHTHKQKNTRVILLKLLNNWSVAGNTLSAQFYRMRTDRRLILCTALCAYIEHNNSNEVGRSSETRMYICTHIQAYIATNFRVKPRNGLHCMMN